MTADEMTERQRDQAWIENERAESLRRANGVKAIDPGGCAPPVYVAERSRLDEAVSVAGAILADHALDGDGPSEKALRVALLAALPVLLHEDEVKWIVNDNAELGVMIHHRAYFLYKGHSLVYEDGKHDNGQPMKYRPVFKREFGECCYPINWADYSRIGTVSTDDSGEWRDLPVYAPSLGEGHE